MFLDSKLGKVSINHNDVGSDSVVILGHGYLSNKNSRTGKALSKCLNENGISTITYDLYGHGESEGDIEHLTVSKAVETLLSVYDFAQTRYKKIGLVGSSFTGSISLICASKKHPDVIALKCPVFSSNELWDWRLNESGVAKWKKEGYLKLFSKRWSYDVYEDAMTYNMREIASKIKSPTIVVHGDQDVTVPMSQAENIAFSVKGEKRLVVIKGADHFFKEEKQFSIVVDTMCSWLCDYLS